MEEKNKRITEFMGADQENTLTQTGICRYSTSWDCLMPVVEKITDMDAVTEFDINYDSVFGARAQIVPAYKDSFQIITVKEKSMRKATFEAVSEFAEWYNRNTK